MTEAVETIEKVTPQKTIEIKILWRELAPTWMVQVHDYLNTPVPGDKYERSEFTIALDALTKVTENQMRFRNGLDEIKVVKPSTPHPDWVDRFEKFLDIKLAFLINNGRESHV